MAIYQGFDHENNDQTSGKTVKVTTTVSGVPSIRPPPGGASKTHRGPRRQVSDENEANTRSTNAYFTLRIFAFMAI
jgi:hypothetical protein